MASESPIPEMLSQSVKKDDQEKPKIIWTDQTEEVLRTWGDISSCYKWLHDKSYRKYKKKNYNYSIPVIILSTLTGALNVGLSGYVPEEYTKYAQAGIGAINIFSGILTTLQNFFKYAQLSESHFNANQGWGKVQRNISVELTLEKEFRCSADRFMRDCRRDYDRLIEQSPEIPSDVIKLFKEKFSSDNTLVRPDIVDNVSHTEIYRANMKTKVNTPESKKDIINLVNIDELKEILIENRIKYNTPLHIPVKPEKPIEIVSNSNKYKIPFKSYIQDKQQNVKDLIKKFTKIDEDDQSVIQMTDIPLSITGLYTPLCTPNNKLSITDTLPEVSSIIKNTPRLSNVKNTLLLPNETLIIPTLSEYSLVIKNTPMTTPVVKNILDETQVVKTILDETQVINTLESSIIIKNTPTATPVVKNILEETPTILDETLVINTIHETTPVINTSINILELNDDRKEEKEDDIKPKNTIKKGRPKKINN